MAVTARMVIVEKKPPSRVNPAVQRSAKYSISSEKPHLTGDLGISYAKIGRRAGWQVDSC
jgi:hypothetical protein